MTATQGTTRWRSIFSLAEACSGGDAERQLRQKNGRSGFRLGQIRRDFAPTLPYLRA